MKQQEPRFDPRRLLKVLAHHQVSFVIIGGVAGNIHGSKSFTFDLDVCYARDPANIARLAAALTELRVQLRGADPDLPFRPDARTIRSGLNFTFTTELGDLDCLGEASGYTFDVLYPNSHRADLGGVVVAVVDLDDLIRMKRAAGRNKDLIEVENLSALRDVRDGRVP